MALKSYPDSTLIWLIECIMRGVKMLSELSIASFFRILALVVIVSGLLTGTASAHTIAYGYEMAGPDAVTFWFGSSHSNAHALPLEGTLSLVGINGNPFASTMFSFVLSANSQPAGLTNDVNYFVDPLAGLSPVLMWQGTTVALAAGDYQFAYSSAASPSPAWVPFSNFVTTGHQLTVPVPVPGSLALLSVCLAASASVFGRRRSAC